MKSNIFDSDQAKFNIVDPAENGTTEKQFHPIVEYIRSLLQAKDEGINMNDVRTVFQKSDGDPE